MNGAGTRAPSGRCSAWRCSPPRSFPSSATSAALHLLRNPLGRRAAPLALFPARSAARNSLLFYSNAMRSRAMPRARVSSPLPTSRGTSVTVRISIRAHSRPDRPAPPGQKVRRGVREPRVDADDGRGDSVHEDGHVLRRRDRARAQDDARRREARERRPCEGRRVLRPAQVEAGVRGFLARPEAVRVVAPVVRRPDVRDDPGSESIHTCSGGRENVDSRIVKQPFAGRTPSASGGRSRVRSHEIT